MSASCLAPAGEEPIRAAAARAPPPPRLDPRRHRCFEGAPQLAQDNVAAFRGTPGERAPRRRRSRPGERERRDTGGVRRERPREGEGRAG